MQKLISWLENSFAPKMSKVNNNVWVVTLKDSIMQILPFIFLGTIFCWKLKMANRKVKCNSCGKVVLKDEWQHFKHCPACKCEECTPVGKQK